MTGEPSSFASYRPVSRLVEPGPGDRQARGRSAGELAVGAGRERGRALVPDADVAQLAAFLGAAQRVGETEIGVADHAEDVRDAERDQRLDQHVGDGADGRRDGSGSSTYTPSARSSTGTPARASLKPSGG